MKRAAVMLSAVAIAVFTRPSRADSVAQIQTAKRITAQTIEIIDPQGGTSTGGAGSNVNYAVGDILTFQFRFTPVENGATRGLGGYITEYVPANTEVVGARIVETHQCARAELTCDRPAPRTDRSRHSGASLREGATCAGRASPTGRSSRAG